jgi:hypothetical protein
MVTCRCAQRGLRAQTAGIRACATLMVSSTATAANAAESRLSLRSVVRPRSDEVRTCFEKRILPEALAFAAKVDRMDEGHLGLDETDLPEKPRQIEAERIVDSTEPVIACGQLLEAHVTIGGRKREQSSKVGVDANHKAARPRDFRHFAQRIKRANEMAEQAPAVNAIERSRSRPVSYALAWT